MIHPEGRSLLPSPPAPINAFSYPNTTGTQLNRSAGFFRLTPHFPCPLYLDFPTGHGSNSKIHGQISNEPREIRGRDLVSEKAALLQLEELPGAAAAAPQDGWPRKQHQGKEPLAPGQAGPEPSAGGQQQGGFEKPTPQCSGLRPAADVVGRRGRCETCPVPEPLGPRKEFNGIGGAKAGPLHR